MKKVSEIASVPRLEMQIEELKDKRRLFEGKTGSSSSGCGVLLLIAALVIFVFVHWIFGLALVIVAAVMISSSGNKKQANSEIEDIDTQIKQLRQEIVELKEKRT